MNNKMLDILNGQEAYMYERYGDDILLDHGPAHIVYSDHNLTNNDIYFCTGEIVNMLCDTERKDDLPIFDGWTDRDRVYCLLDIYWCLSLLLLIPEEERYVYDNNEYWNEDLG